MTAVSLAPSESKLVKLTPQDTPQLHVLNPRLWWPNGYGEPNLYTMRLRFEIVGGAVSDENDFNFGIRKIQYDVPGLGFPHSLRQRRAASSARAAAGDSTRR